MSDRPLLVAEGLAVGHGAATVAAGIDLALLPGTVTCLLGPNGVGKTTLFRTLLGLLPPRAGRVLLGGEDLRELSRAGVARRLAYVPQAHAGAFAYTVLDLVVMGRTASLGTFASPGRADMAAARDALGRLGIAALAERDATRISGGQLQLALIARALAQRTGAVVMDEPTASLDLGNRVRVQDVVRGLAADGLAVLVSTHEPEQAFALADQVAVIAPGGRFEAGPPGRLLTSESLSHLYGVELLVETTPSGRRVVGGAPSLTPFRPATANLQPSATLLGNGSDERGATMATEPSDAETAGQRADPVASQSDELAQEGGAGTGEPGAGGPAYASGGQQDHGSARPSGSRPSRSPADAPAPLVHTAMDEEVRDAEEKARRLSRP